MSVRVMAKRIWMKLGIYKFRDLEYHEYYTDIMTRLLFIRVASKASRGS